MASTLEVYLFNADTLRRLDSYRLAETGTEALDALSGGGEKLIVALSGTVPPAEPPRSWYALGERVQRLADENPARPVMSATARFTAGDSRAVVLQLRPLSGRITLRSVRCDFSGKPYEGAVLRKVRAYLINVSDEVALPGDGEPVPRSWMQVGALNSAELARMAHPELLAAELPDIGSSAVLPGLSFWAYPNAPQRESLGHPFTRLVLEGELEGRRCYYPVNVAVRRDTELVLDLVITRPGTDDPDTPADSDVIRVRASREGFQDRNERVINY